MGDSSEEDIKQSYSITIIICDFSCAIFAFSFREIIGRIFPSQHQERISSISEVLLLHSSSIDIVIKRISSPSSFTTRTNEERKDRKYYLSYTNISTALF